MSSLLPYGDQNGVIAMYAAAIDESGTHAGAPMLSVACCVATSGQWERFREEWSPTAARYKNGYHAKDGTHADNLELTRLINKHIEAGFAIRIAYKIAKRIPLEIRSRYGGEYPACIRACVGSVSAWCDQNKIEWVAFVIEDGHKSVDAAKNYFEYLKAASGAERRHVWSDTWVGKGELTVHPSDLIAHEWAQSYGGSPSLLLAQLPRIICVDWNEEELDTAIRDGRKSVAKLKRDRAHAKAKRRPSRN